MNATLIAVANEIEYRNIRLVCILTKTSTQLLQEDGTRFRWAQKEHHVDTRNIHTLVQDIYSKQDLQIPAFIL